MWMILTILFLGMAAGWLASLVVRGDRRPSDWGLLLGVGIGGSLLGGLVVNLVRGNGLDFAFTGLIGSVAGAILLLALITAFGGGRSKDAATNASGSSAGSRSGTGGQRSRKSRGSSKGGHRRNKRR